MSGSVRQAKKPRTPARRVSAVGRRGPPIRDIAAQQLELAADWFWECGPDLRFTSISEGFERVTGIAVDHLLSGEGLATFACGLAPPARSLFLDSLGDREAFGDVEWSVGDVTGGRRHFLIRGKPILGPRGGYRGYLGVARDITALREAEAALEQSPRQSDRAELKREREEAAQSEARFRDFAEASSDWLWEMGPDLRFTYLSESYGPLSGLDPQWLLGRKRKEFLDTESLELPVWKKHLEDLRARRPFLNFTFCTLPQDGKERWFRTSGKPIYGKDGKFLGYRGTGANVTAEMKARYEALQKSQRMRSIIDNMPQAVAVFDKDLTLIESNEQFGDLLEIPNGLLLEGTPIEKLLQHHGVSGAFTGNGIDEVRRNLSRLGKSASRVERVLSNGNVVAVRTSPMPDGGILFTFTDITERKQAAAAVLGREQRIHAIMENAADGLISIDQAGRIESFNRAAVEMFGWSAQEVVGRSVDILIAGSERSQGGGEPSVDLLAVGTREVIARRKDGIAFPTELALAQVHIEDRLHYIAAVRDVTDRKRAEAALRSSQERFRDFAEASSHWLWEVGPNLRFTFVSDGVRHATGQLPEDFLGKTRWEIDEEHLVEDDEFRDMLGRLRTLLESQEAFSDFVFTRPVDGGGKVHLAISGRPVVTEDGCFAGYRGTARNITERVHVQQEVEEARARLSEAIETISEGFTLYDSDDRLVLCNSRYREMFAEINDVIVPGVKAETIFRSAAERGIYDDDTEDLEAWLAKRIDVHRNPQGPFERKLRDGRWIRVSERRTKDGHIVGIRTDITALRRVEEHLREAEKLTALGQLAGGVAHDFNNILMVIDGYTKRSMARINDESVVRESLEEVVMAAEKARSLTAQLLMFGRRKALETKVIRAVSVLDELETMLRPLLGETIDLKIECLNRDACVEIDPGLFSQALINLAINGRDAMPRGGRLRITLDRLEAADSDKGKSDGTGNRVLVSVSDQGTGMDDKTVNHIFEPFFTTKDQGKGTGLGLAMVYGFVKESQGTIEVGSEPGKGSTFTILLPEVEGAPAFTTTEKDRAEISAKGETILLAEDDSALRRLAQTTLEELGYQVLAASDGFEAIELEGDHEGPIHLLLSDVVMPGLGGFELTATVRQTRPSLQVVLMSGYPARGVDEMMEAPEGVAILQKPLDPEALARAVRCTLDAQVAAV